MSRLELYVPTIEELDYRQKILSDPETMFYNKGYDLEFDGYHKDTGCIDFPESEWFDWYEYFVGQEPERFYAYIRRKDDGAFIGEVNVHKKTDEDYDMGILIEAKYRGRDYSGEALNLLLRHAFEDMKVKSIQNTFESERYAAMKVHLDCGFREVGRENGIIHLMITAEDYEKISIEEVSLDDIADFWNAHIRYLADDGIIDGGDEEDMEYYTGSEYRGILEYNMRRHKDRHHLIYFVLNGSRVGAASYCIFHDEEGKCYLMDFWVFPEYRGNGMGHRCFKTLDEYVKADGAKYYEINSTKEDSVRFWKSLGFEEAGVDEYDVPLYVRR